MIETEDTVANTNQSIAKTNEKIEIDFSVVIVKWNQINLY